MSDTKYFGTSLISLCVGRVGRVGHVGRGRCVCPSTSLITRYVCVPIYARDNLGFIISFFELGFLPALGLIE